MATEKRGWEFLSIHPTISSCPNRIPSVQNSEVITRGAGTMRTGQSRSHVNTVAECWNRLLLQQHSQACKAVAVCVNHNGNYVEK